MTLTTIAFVFAIVLIAYCIAQTGIDEWPRRIVWIVAAVLCVLIVINGVEPGIWRN